MPELKTKCAKCGAEILVTTARRTGGICMKCEQAANPPNYAVTAEDEMRFKEIDKIVLRLHQGCSEEEFAQLRCPVCNGAVTLSVHPSLNAFCVRCADNTLHFIRHESTSRAPRWWKKRITGGWYDDPHCVQSQN